jgi:cytochrome c553
MRSGGVALAAIAVAAAAEIAASGYAAAQGNISRGRQLAQTHHCVSCHSGEAPEEVTEAPYLAGQKLYYLQKQLAAFQRPTKVPATASKVVQRSHRVMSPESAPLREADIQDLAEYFANLPCTPRRSGAPGLDEAPAKAQRCSYCHGATGVNPYNIVPNLGGQKKAYLVEQLTALRASALDQGSSADYDRYHRMMAPSVFDLTASEVEGLADYYARQSCRAQR